MSKLAHSNEETMKIIEENDCDEDRLVFRRATYGSAAFAEENDEALSSFREEAHNLGLNSEEAEAFVCANAIHCGFLSEDDPSIPDNIRSRL